MLKKNCYFLIVMFFSTTMNAQFKKGYKMIGPSIGSFVFNSGSSNTTVASIGSNIITSKGYNISIQPLYGWFISDKTVVGGLLNINPNSQKYTYEENGSTYQSDKSTGFSISVGGFARNYFSDNQNSLHPFGQISLTAGINNLKTQGFFYGGSGNNAYKITYTGNSSGGFATNAAFLGGVTKMLGENAGLDFYAGYTYMYTNSSFKKTTLRDNMINGTIDERGENETRIKFTNHGFMLGVGFQIFLRGNNQTGQ